MSTGIPMISFNIKNGLTITRNKMLDDLPDGIKKNLLLDLLSIVETISDRAEESVKADFYNDWLPSIRSAVIRTEKALWESSMPTRRQSKKQDDISANNKNPTKDSGGEA